MKSGCGERGEPVSMAQLLLLSGVYHYDRTTSLEGRRHAGRVMGELLAVATAHGFSRPDELRGMLQRIGHAAGLRGGRASFTPEAVALANAALANVPNDAISAALARADALHMLIG